MQRGAHTHTLRCLILLWKSKRRVSAMIGPFSSLGAQKIISDQAEWVNLTILRSAPRWGRSPSCFAPEHNRETTNQKRACLEKASKHIHTCKYSWNPLRPATFSLVVREQHVPCGYLSKLRATRHACLSSFSCYWFWQIQIYTTNNNVVNYDPKPFRAFSVGSWVYGWVDICHWKWPLKGAGLNIRQVTAR